MRTACDKLGISKEVQDSIFAQIKDISHMEWDEFIVLSTTMLGEDLLSSVQVIFDVYSIPIDNGHPVFNSNNSSTRPGAIRSEEFLHLLKMLSRHDPTLTDNSIHQLSQSIKSADITYDEFISLPVLREILKI
eukprot:TRINITY_DN15_c0_g1_i5.p1 TRINITY_DN15_c0_g1~~TRINITY_DN15_c0_g1_i5.p1  ORF type:complete len:133 (+),score=32.73 TRINITY_DN15_c0_g1_i5:277-675(+)